LCFSYEQFLHEWFTFRIETTREEKLAAHYISTYNSLIVAWNEQLRMEGRVEEGR
jgi:hypothetical protein